MRATDHPRVRLMVTAALAPAAEVTLAPAQAHYLCHVLRLGPGASVRVFNGRDGEWAAAIARADRGGVHLRLLDQTRAQDAVDGPWLAFAPLKKDSQDFLVTKATELGAARLVPVFTRLTATARVNAARLRAHAIEAAEQCGRLELPQIEPATPLAERLAAWPPTRRLWVADPGPGGQPIAAALARAAGGPTVPPGFLVGPEGGLAADELDALARLPFAARVHLGPRILRAETAALACLAVWQALAGARGATG
jgi:16S rRNA (uracil1498-N3)-methyltransferase